jgi:DsbC/DsbD-like thiol-disulfide interchange protein
VSASVKYWPRIVLSVFLTAQGISILPAAGEDLQSAWVEGFNYRVRLTGGSISGAKAQASHAFVEVEMPKGWKTYWRNPGDAGGIPPSFDWSASKNLDIARVLYPVPQRLTDKAGDTIGYKERAIFPVAVTAKTAGEPIILDLKMTFGVCEKICVPAEAALQLELPAGNLPEASADAAAALASVPSPATALQPGDPSLVSLKQDLSGAAPRLVFEVKAPGHSEDVDLFLDIPDGLYFPQPRRQASAQGDVTTFEIDLSKDVDLQALKGKTITATLRGGAGQSEHIFTID